MRIDRHAIGVGLRPVYQGRMRDPAPLEVDWLEVIVENFLQTGPVPQENLRQAAQRAPVSLHGVSLGLLGSAELDWDHVDRVARLAQEIQAPCFSDHLCWTRQGHWESHDLLPHPYSPDLLQHAVERARAVQDRLPVPFGLENLSSYAGFRSSTMSEWEFYTRVIRESGTWAMLDLNNIFVSSRNHGFDPRAYLEAVDWDRVLYVHIAGHTVRPDGLIIDTHDHPVRPEVWELFRDAWVLGGPFPTLLEWDDHHPAWEDLVTEVLKARKLVQGLGAGPLPSLAPPSTSPGHAEPTEPTEPTMHPAPPLSLAQWPRWEEGWRRSTSASLQFGDKGIFQLPQEEVDPGLLSDVQASGLEPRRRLEAYRMQYWFRLLTVLQGQYPLLVHCMGLHSFNPLAARWLERRQPSNLARLGVGLPTASGLESNPLQEAATVDQAYLLAFLEPQETLLDPVHLEGLEQGTMELGLQPSVHLLELHWDWLPLRSRCEATNEAQTLPPRLPEPRHLVLSRKGSQLVAQSVPAWLFTLFQAMKRGESWQEALEGLSSDCLDQVSTWFARGVEHAWWRCTPVSAFPALSSHEMR